jgi:hypothetical protein
LCSGCCHNLRLLVVGFTQHRSAFVNREDHVGFVVNRLAVGKVSL